MYAENYGSQPTCKGYKSGFSSLGQSGKTDSGYYTLTEVRGYTMYEFII